VLNEATIREEMFKECTFQPKIKELPLAYGIGKDSKGEYNDKDNDYGDNDDYNDNDDDYNDDYNDDDDDDDED
jgi:hypothetical protein